MQTNSHDLPNSLLGPNGEMKHAPMPDSSKFIDKVVISFKQAHAVETEHKQKFREAWFNAMGKIHQLVGIFRRNVELQIYLKDTLKLRKNSNTTDQLYLLKMVYRRAGLEIPDQTQHDHSLILIGLEAAGVPNEVDAAEKWLKEAEDFGNGPISGKEKAMIYAKKARKNQSRNKAAEARMASAARKREAQFGSYMSPKLSAPLADLQIEADSTALANGYQIVLVLKETDRIRFLDVVTDDIKSVQTTTLRKR